MKSLVTLYFFTIFISVFEVLVMFNKLIYQTPRFLCYPDTYLDYRINENFFCSKDTHYDVVIVINSASRNYYRREAIRFTWGNASHYSSLGYKVKAVFLLGNPELLDADLRENVMKERNTFKDIFFINTEEAYRNNIHKTLYGLKLVDRYCPDSDLVIKADDDIFVDVPKLYHSYMKDPSRSSAVWCSINSNSAVRNPKEGWYVDPRVYGHDYPSYCFGSFYTLNKTAASTLIKMAYCEAWFWIDDVSVTGDLRTRANIPITGLTRDDEYMSSGYSLYNKTVDMTNAKDLKMLYHHNLSPQAMHYLWSLVLLKSNHDNDATSSRK